MKTNPFSDTFDFLMAGTWPICVLWVLVLLSIALALYNLRRDPSELFNVVDNAEVNDVLDSFRRTLLDVLNGDLGSTEVENAYLARYRRMLKSEVRVSPQAPGPMSAVESH